VPDNRGVTPIDHLQDAIARHISLYAYSTYQTKTESIGFAVTPSYDCRLRYRAVDHVLCTCWRVIVSNQSDICITLRSFDTKHVEEKYEVVYGEVDSLIEDGNGNALQLPIVIDGGDAKALIISARETDSATTP
jgi:hypothetical protein